MIDAAPASVWIIQCVHLYLYLILDGLVVYIGLCLYRSMSISDAESLSAFSVHILTALVVGVFEAVDRSCSHHCRWQAIPMIDNSLTKEIPSDFQSRSLLIQLQIAK